MHILVSLKTQKISNMVYEIKHDILGFINNANMLIYQIILYIYLEKDYYDNADDLERNHTMSIQ